MVYAQGRPVACLAWSSAPRPLMGVTTGRGKADMTHQANRSIKQVFGLALVKDFRQRLSIVA